MPTVFCSWQPDLPGSSNRAFLESILELLPVTIVDRNSDRTLTQIGDAALMVADLSTLSPNVLFELGYAVHALGWERVVLLFNLAQGNASEIPLELPKERLFTYHLQGVQEEAESKATLEKAILDTLAKVPATEAKPGPLEILEKRLAQGGAYGVEAAVVDLWSDVLARARTIVGWDSPEFHRQALTYETFLERIQELLPVVEDFSLACYRCAIHRSQLALREIYRGFAELAPLCDSPPNQTTHAPSTHYDVIRFIGHEMFVAFVAGMIRHQCWDSLASAYWAEEWGTLPRHNLPLVHTSSFSRSTTILEASGPPIKTPSRQIERLSVMLRTDLLAERHGPGGPLFKACPLSDFQAADIFLLLRHAAQFPQDGTSRLRWVPWSCAMADEMPLFLTRATSRQHAQLLADTLGLKGTEQFRKTLKVAARRLGAFFDGPLEDGPELAHLMARAARLVPEWSEVVSE
jgi:hypothetical protein